MLGTSIIVGLLGAVEAGLFTKSEGSRGYRTDEYRSRWNFFAVRAPLMIVVAYCANWYFLPCTTGLGLGAMNWWLLLLFTLITQLWTSVGDFYNKPPVILRWTPSIIALLAIFLGNWNGGWYYTNGKEKSRFIGTVATQPWDKSLAPIDTGHIRLVSQRQAEWIGKGALLNGEGSQFAIGDYTVQKMGDELIYVAPLDYHGYNAQNNSAATPGVVVVHGHDPKAAPSLIETNKLGKPLKIRLTEEGWFSRKLARHLYQAGYSDYRLEDFHLEFDDDQNPFWIVPLVKPTLGFGGDRIEGILIVNPDTGAIEKKRIEEVPAWVDRVYPKSIALTYIAYWGELHSGGWDACFNSTTGLQLPDGHVQVVWGADGRCYYYVGLTSNSSKDHTMLSYLLMDTRTGVATQYQVDNSLGSARTVDAILANVGALVSNFKFEATDAIPYNTYGVIGYICPIVNASHVFESVAISDLSGQRIVVEPDLRRALQSFRAALAKEPGQNRTSPTQKATAVTVEGLVFRVNSEISGGNTTYYLMLSNTPAKKFYGSSTVSTDLIVTRDGDDVRISFTETGEPLVPLISFENKTAATSRR